MTPVRLLIALVIWFCAAGFSKAAVLIACVGDSITAGVGVLNAAQESYPAKLQRLLGTNYSVQNDGLSGATLLKSGDLPYWGTAPHVRSYSQPKPDIIIIMLGTNDSKPQNWAHGTNFYSDYEALIALYTNVTTNPRILICTPPPCFGNNLSLINQGIIATNITPLIKTLGTNYDLQVIDMQSLLAGHSEWFNDRVHPNSPGTTAMAAIVYTALMGDTMNGVIPGLEISTISSAKALLSWPAGGAGWVLQARPGNLNTWTNVGPPAVNDGTLVRVTNTLAGPVALFRLWQPSLP